MAKYGKFTQEDRYFKESSFGRNGFRVVTNGTTLPSEERYITLYVTEDAELTVTSEKGDNLSSETLSAGSIIYGLFSEITVASGKLIAYIA